MGALRAQKRIASELLNCGLHRVYFEPEFTFEIELAITRNDINGLIKQGIIKKRQKIGISKARTKALHDRKKRGRARGIGKRKGKAGARTPGKRAWINKIRPQRVALKNMRTEGKIDRAIYRKMYLMAKGGSFKSVGVMQRYMIDNKFIKK